MDCCWRQRCKFSSLPGNYSTSSLMAVPLSFTPKPCPCPGPCPCPATVKQTKGLCAKHTFSCVNGMVLRASYPNSAVVSTSCLPAASVEWKGYTTTGPM
eukprot:Gb_03177 [translate_table: standard]